MTERWTYTQRLRYRPGDDFEARCRKRLMEDLGVTEDDADLILHLRSQVLELQDRIRDLENELLVRRHGQSVRLSVYEVYSDAVWHESDGD